ncbi:MAG: hypothetical protein WHS90_10435 [Caldilinea sp.]|jgi:hypothetical protein|uniref:hypothetical protein n=1 Tax=Caldilinea sp. TaxID=2293560 RepID=UPI0030A812BC
MNTQVMSQEQIRIAGMEALRRELGLVGMIRFMQQFETGYGDYSRERHLWLDNESLDTVLERLRARRVKHD